MGATEGETQAQALVVDQLRDFTIVWNSNLTAGNENDWTWRILTGMETPLLAVKRAPASKPPSTITVEPGGYMAPIG